MARVEIAIANLARSKNPALVIALTTVVDGVNDHQWSFSSGDILYAYNNSVGTYQISIVSAPNKTNRTATTIVSVAPGETYVFGPFKADGWVQTDGKILVNIDDAGAFSMYLAVLRGVRLK